MQQPIDHPNLTQNFVADATGFMELSARAGTPFLLYLAFAHMHVSMFSNKMFVGTSKNGLWGDGVREMDWAVGKVFTTLKTEGVADNTLSFFTSDHVRLLHLRARVWIF